MLYYEQLRRMPYNLYSLTWRLLKKRKSMLKAKKVLYMYIKLKKPKFKFRFRNQDSFRFFWRVDYIWWFLQFYILRFYFYNICDEEIVFKKKIFSIHAKKFLHVKVSKSLNFKYAYLKEFVDWWKVGLRRQLKYKQHRSRLMSIRWHFDLFPPSYSREFFLWNFKSVYKPRIKPLREDIIDYLFFVEKFKEYNLPSKFLYEKTKNFQSLIISNFIVKCALKLYIILLNSNFLTNKYYLIHFIRRCGVLVNKNLVYAINFVLLPWDLITFSVDTRYFLFFEFQKNVIMEEKIWWNIRLFYDYLRFKKENLYEFSRVKEKIVEHRESMLNTFFCQRWVHNLQKIKKNKTVNLLVNYGRYTEVNYKLFMIIVIKLPLLQDLNKKLWLETQRTSWKWKVAQW